MTRAEADAKAASAGAHVVDSVSEHTDYLVFGSGAGSRITRAEATCYSVYNFVVLTEAEFAAAAAVSVAEQIEKKGTSGALTVGTCVVGVGVGIVAAVAAPAVATAAVGALGFGPSGVAAGSAAAGMMTSTTATGSLFAAAQSIGATGSLAYLGAGGAAAVKMAVGTAAGAAAGGTVATINKVVGALEKDRASSM